MCACSTKAKRVEENEKKDFLIYCPRKKFQKKKKGEILFIIIIIFIFFSNLKFESKIGFRNLMA